MLSHALASAQPQLGKSPALKALEEDAQGRMGCCCGLRLACCPSSPVLWPQVRVDGSQDAHLYETVPVVDGSPILRDLLFSPDHQHIYLLSEKQVGPEAAAAGGCVGAERVLTRSSPGEPAPSGDMRAVLELRSLPGLQGPALWLVCAAAQVREAVWGWVVTMAQGGSAPGRSHQACWLGRVVPALAHMFTSPSQAPVASPSLPFHFLQLMSRISTPSDVTRTPWAKALWAGAGCPLSPQAPHEPWTEPSQGRCGMGCG